MLRLDTLFVWKGEIWGENLAVWTQVMPPLRQTKKKKKKMLSGDGNLTLLSPVKFQADA